MGVSGLFKRGEREDKFIGLLIQQSEITAEGLRLLEKFVSRAKGGAEAVEKMRAKEAEADEIRRILIDELHNTFVTPLDREDIFTLSLYIDDILDYAYTTIEEVELLGIDADEHLTEMIAFNREAAEEIELAIKRLSANPRVAAEHARRAKKMENKVEHLYRLAISDLFKKAKDFKPLMLMLRRREVYRHVSNMADRANDAADVIGMVVMKMA
jgi:uncharacterized protein Yka (UPF0111/DUF47 family)